MGSCRRDKLGLRRVDAEGTPARVGRAEDVRGGAHHLGLTRGADKLAVAAATVGSQKTLAIEADVAGQRMALGTANLVAGDLAKGWPVRPLAVALGSSALSAYHLVTRPPSPE